ncbi:unnamed protein product [Rotaria socialis]|uniref:Uncharacterized protein n=1 Tax=Rotaria socialis TaxID=392032 RepID=A0A818FKQ1_9BILA|nr:unnamed protein product [Rotaria socialis]CAF4833950.1 unnamed protein product [Rotaria socialis]
MHLFLGWRPMQDRIGYLGHTIERCLWGDGRARHTFLLASTNEHPLVLIEIDVGDSKKGIKKSMKLNIVELNEIPKKIARIEYLGHIKSSQAYENLIQSANSFVNNHPNYHVVCNNCRTFVEYLIDEIPECHNSIPRENGSILEYYHVKEKHDHPGVLVKSQKLMKFLRDLHRHNKEHKSTAKLLFDLQSSALDINNNNNNNNNSKEPVEDLL